MMMAAASPYMLWRHQKNLNQLKGRIKATMTELMNKNQAIISSTRKYPTSTLKIRMPAVAARLMTT